MAGVVVDAGPEAVWVRSGAPLRVLTSALVGAHLPRARHILNVRVGEGYRAARPAADLRAFARRLGIAEPFVGLMTAARTEAAVPVTEAAEGVTVTAIATVGLGSPVAAGLSPPAPWRPSTINVVAILDARLARAAAVNAVATVTEAKVAALAEAGVRTPEGRPATGTATDAVVVAWTGCGPRLEFLGPAALGGWLLARAVRRAVARGLEGP